jgi:hypothetical protein
VLLYFSLTSALDGVVGQRHVPSALPRGNDAEPKYRRQGGSQGRLDGSGKPDFPSVQRLQDRFEAIFASCLRDYWGTRWRSWLRHLARVWRVVVSTPDEVNDSILPAAIWPWG